MQLWELYLFKIFADNLDSNFSDCTVESPRSSEKIPGKIQRFWFSFSEVELVAENMILCLSNWQILSIGKNVVEKGTVPHI